MSACLSACPSLSCLSACLFPFSLSLPTHIHKHPTQTEGEFIRRTAPVVLLFLLLAQAIGLIFTLGNVLPDKPLLSVF